ncbi:Hypothetical predicted protein, partial [Paramuricea clavata]
FNLKPKQVSCLENLFLVGHLTDIYCPTVHKDSVPYFVPKNIFSTYVGDRLYNKNFKTNVVAFAMVHLEMKLAVLKKKPAFPKGKVRNVTPENLSKLSSELFGYISTTNAINALEDEYCLFGQTPHVSENTVKDILTHAELISTEDDLLTELGIWDQTHSSAIFSLILKYSS